MKGPLDSNKVEELASEVTCYHVGGEMDDADNTTTPNGTGNIFMDHPVNGFSQTLNNTSLTHLSYFHMSSTYKFPKQEDNSKQIVITKNASSVCGELKCLGIKVVTETCFITIEFIEKSRLFSQFKYQPHKQKMMQHSDYYYLSNPTMKRKEDISQLTTVSFNIQIPLQKHSKPIIIYHCHDTLIQNAIDEHAHIVLTRNSIITYICKNGMSFVHVNSSMNWFSLMSSTQYIKLRIFNNILAFSA